MNVVDVFFGGTRVYEDIINVDRNILVYAVSENLVDCGLESGRTIRGAKRHDDPFEMTILGAESSLMNIGGMNSDLMITGGKIKLSEVLGGGKSIEDLSDVGKCSTIFDGVLVEGTIVENQAEFSLLLNVEDWGCVR